MSVDASIGLRVVNINSRTVISPTKSLDIFLKNGWNLLNRDACAFYLPIGDNDMFDWTESNLDMSMLMSLLAQKEAANELIGVRVTWGNTEIGGNLLLWSDNEAKNKNIHTPISLGLDGNRKMLSGSSKFKITDVNWYLEKLLPIFNQGETIVEYFTYEEHI